MLLFKPSSRYYNISDPARLQGCLIFQEHDVDLKFRMLGTNYCNLIVNKNCVIPKKLVLQKDLTEHFLNLA